jgi:hypothetical protein
MSFPLKRESRKLNKSGDLFHPNRVHAACPPTGVAAKQRNEKFKLFPCHLCIHLDLIKILRVRIPKSEFTLRSSRIRP